MPKKYEMLTPRELSQLRHVSLSYVYCEFWANRIPGAKKFGKKWRIPREAVQEKIRRVEIAKHLG